jgi:hypothetical protein
MVSVSVALLRIKSELHLFLPEQAIRGACRRAGYCWRERKLGPVQTVHLFILQVLNFNTAMTALRHLSHTAIKAPAYCRARMRLPLAVLEALLLESSSAMRWALAPGEGRWCGLRAYLVDGSSTIAPDTADSQKAFGQPKGCKRGCGFPVPKVVGLFAAFSGLMVQVLGLPLYTHEQSKVWMLHPRLGAGDLLVGDRGLCSYVHLAMLWLRGVQGMFRMHQRTIADFRPGRTKRRQGQTGKPRSRFIKRLGKHDQIVEYARTPQRPAWMDAKQYATIPLTLRLRELRYVLPRRGQRTLCVTIVTTLLDPLQYPREKIAELYGVRWRAETHFAQLKTTLRMRKLKSKTSQGVLKELAIYALVYNLVHMVMLRSARAQRVEPHRISFIDALRWLLYAAPAESLLTLRINPHRPDRHEPRVVKDREDTYPKMTRPRAKLRKELMRKREGIK